MHFTLKRANVSVGINSTIEFKNREQLLFKIGLFKSSMTASTAIERVSGFPRVTTVVTIDKFIIFGC